MVCHVGMYLYSNPISLVPIERLANRFKPFFQVCYFVWLTLDGYLREIIHVKIAEHVTADIKHKDGKPSLGKLLKGCSLGHIG